MSETERTYRRWLDTDLRSFEVRIDESDLLISLSPEALAKGDVSHRDLAKRALASMRADLESYLRRDRGFAPALQPYDPLPDAPAIAHEMAAAARACGVGPMAAVAGAVAQHVGEALLAETPQVIVENGGDIFLYTTRPRTAAIFAGSSPLSGRLGLCISRTGQGIGLCTSSGTVGPSLSFGRADAAIVLAGSAALADAAATALGNRIQTEADIAPALEHLQALPGILGGAVIIGEHLGAWGEVEVVRIAQREREGG